MNESGNAAPAYSVIVPVRDEARILSETTPALLAAVEKDAARLIYVCNDCTDDSAALLRRLVGSAAEVIELDTPGKPAAIRAGEAAAGDVFPRFFLDADIRVPPDVFTLLRAALADGAELVAPYTTFDLSRCSAAARSAARIWQALPYANQASAGHGLVGVSAAGRARWGVFPDVIGDDAFISISVPPEKRRFVPGASTTTWPPPTFAAWVRTRARWLRGDLELAARGLPPDRASGQRRALLALALRPRTAPDALVYLAVRLLASLAARRPNVARDWRPRR